MLAPNTQRSHLAVWNAHVRDRFDHHRLSTLAADPQLFEELTAEMRSRGVGPAAQRRVLMVISAVLTAAVGWKKIAVNPIAQVPKPPGTRQRHPRPFPPVVVERIRDEILRRQVLAGDRHRSLGDACLVSLMAYAGLRPGEALALRFSDVQAKTIAVDKAIAEGEERQTKTGRARIVPLVFWASLDVSDWKVARYADADDLVFPASDGGYWSRLDFANWRRRVWKPAVERVAASDPALAWLASARPYDCRRSFVSLHLRAGATPLEVASWAGHSPHVMFNHYAGVIQELVGEPVLPAEEQIARARQAVSERPEDELARLMADLVERPTEASGGARSQAWQVFYSPGEGMNRGGDSRAIGPTDERSRGSRTEALSLHWRRVQPRRLHSTAASRGLQSWV